MKDSEPTLTREAFANAIGWFEDFQRWQAERFWSDLSDAGAELTRSNYADVSTLGTRLSAVVNQAGGSGQPTGLLSLVDLGAEVREVLDHLREQTNARLRFTLNGQLRQNARLLDDLAAFMDTLADSAEETDGEETDADGDDDDEEENPPQTRLGAAVAAYEAALRTQARNYGPGVALGAVARPPSLNGWAIAA